MRPFLELTLATLLLQGAASAQPVPAQDPGSDDRGAILGGIGPRAQGTARGGKGRSRRMGFGKGAS